MEKYYLSYIEEEQSLLEYICDPELMLIACLNQDSDAVLIKDTQTGHSLFGFVRLRFLGVHYNSLEQFEEAIEHSIDKKCLASYRQLIRKKRIPKRASLSMNTSLKSTLRPRLPLPVDIRVINYFPPKATDLHPPMELWRISLAASRSHLSYVHLSERVGEDNTESLPGILRYRGETGKFKPDIGLTSLSEYERELIRLAQLGYKDEEVSEFFNRSLDWVRNLKRSIFEKLGIHKMSEVIAYCRIHLLP